MAIAHDNRTRALRRYQLLDTTPEESFDAITRLASAICRAPMSAISFLDVDRQWFKSEVGLGISATPLSASFCRHAVAQDVPMVVRDALLDPRFADNELVTHGPKLRFYAGCALYAPDGTALGTICVLDTEPRPDGLTITERSALQVLARQVEAQLELRLAMVERETQTKALRDLTTKLEYVGAYDTLTGLPNRAHFAATLEQSVKDCERNGSSLALILLDVDHFKQTNDALGHDAGDALLRAFAKNLRKVIRRSDTAARVGGDEFAIVLTGLSTENIIPEIVKKLSDRLEVPVRHRGRTIVCRASIGIATYPRNAQSVVQLTKCSDLALAAAKLTRVTAVHFEQKLLDDFDGKLRSVAAIRQAYHNDEFRPYYQPKINLASGERVGFEALLRWTGPNGGAPAEIFDSAFPDKALVASIGHRMIEKILDDAQRWTRAGLHFGHIAINAAAIDFAGNDFAEILLNQLGERQIAPRAIELEVTEGVFLGREACHVARALRVLREAGVSIALDDFGTGYASLTHLQHFPVDVLKIDRSFVGGITRNIDDAAIVRAVIGLAKNLGIATVAEGVETLAQAAFVRHHGCDFGQGFLYGAAVAAEQVNRIAMGSQEASAS